MQEDLVNQKGEIRGNLDGGSSTGDSDRNKAQGWCKQGPKAQPVQLQTLYSISLCLTDTTDIPTHDISSPNKLGSPP